MRSLSGSRIRREGKDGLLPSQESRGAFFVGDLAPRFYLRPFRYAPAPSRLGPRPGRDPVSGAARASTPQRFHTLFIRVAQPGVEAPRVIVPADESPPHCAKASSLVPDDHVSSGRRGARSGNKPILVRGRHC